MPGHWHRAAIELERVYAEFEALQMHGLAAMVALDLAELRLIEGNLAAVIDLSRKAMDQFQRSGLTYTSRALTALAFLSEACSGCRTSLRFSSLRLPLDKKSSRGIMAWGQLVGEQDTVRR